MSGQGSTRSPPSLLLTMFLKETNIDTGAVDDQGRPQTPQTMLAAILDDERWDREMLEYWFQKKDSTAEALPTLTPDPERKALYLILLKKLEERGKDKRVRSVSTSVKPQMRVSTAIAQKNLPDTHKDGSDDDLTPTQASFDSKSKLARGSSALNIVSDLEDVPLEEGEPADVAGDDFEEIKNTGPLKDRL